MVNSNVQYVHIWVLSDIITLFFNFKICSTFHGMESNLLQTATRSTLDIYQKCSRRLHVPLLKQPSAPSAPAALSRNKSLEREENSWVGKKETNRRKQRHKVRVKLTTYQRQKEADIFNKKKEKVGKGREKNACMDSWVGKCEHVES